MEQTDEQVAPSLDQLHNDMKVDDNSKTISFSRALIQLKTGGKVARGGWNGKGMWLELQVPDEYSKMTLPYIYMTTVEGARVPWLASQTDLLANDWEIVG